ncbi:MAG: SPASM domain-containing protein [Nitrospirae bacterium]|nr:SPASM domain-containing protein [Nitrospirota bacterium]MBF0533465.1 SPASM domain-containing protein [Nitrospirota bacterium]MBF0616011.1 SPASM domain-containing protein [Nitrospirota bacterium]
MKARNVSGQTPGGKRVALAEVLPLDTPFLLLIFPIHACNFKCNYCLFSVEKANRGFVCDKTSLDINLYKKCIDDAALFPNKLKILRIAGMGEPLLHNNIVEMVEYAVLKNVANTVEIATNASLLTPAMTDALTEAGLSRLLLSIQGTTKKKYKDVSGVVIDFEKHVDNIRYFYNNKKKAHLYIKVVDTALEDKEDEERFYKMFGDICDTIAVEHTVPIVPGVDYGKLSGVTDSSVTQFGLPVSVVRFCPKPFFQMQIMPDGKVAPCCAIPYPIIIDDCNTKSVREIWNGKQFKKFRRRMLDGIENAGEFCANCNIFKFRMSSEDILSNDADRLKILYDI